MWPPTHKWNSADMDSSCNLEIFFINYMKSTTGVSPTALNNETLNFVANFPAFATTRKSMKRQEKASNKKSPKGGE